MSCEQYKSMITAHVDGELSGEQIDELQRHLFTCESCKRELADVTALKEALDMIRFTEPTDAELDRYWRGIYNRLERGAGWVLLSLGAIVLLCYGGFKLVEEIVRDPTVAWVVKGAVLALVFGAVILFVSLLRERLAVRKSDRYSREVEMIVVTTEAIAGMKIVRTLGIVRGNTIRARHIGKDIKAIFRHIIGGEITDYTKLMGESREQALDRMVMEAEKLGANAVVAVRFATSMLMGGAAEILTYGTAVIVEPQGP